VDIIDFVRTSGEGAHRMLGFACDDLDDELVHWHAGGTTNTIAQLLAHMVSAEDLLINERIAGGKSLHQSGWADKTGIPLNRPEIWQRDAWRLDLAAFNDYRLAVQESALRVVDSLTQADLGREVEWVRGPARPAAALLQTVFISHLLGHCGEISALKGLRGLKGLPM
jgi:uncharacterized damage-inducible protein DinB